MSLPSEKILARDAKRQEIFDALKLLNVDADSLFRRIKSELEIGNVREARAELNFIDELLKP